MNQDELKKILEDHRKWLNGTGGERANLREANLYGANLRRANLRRANLVGADLSGANLSGAYLYGADLYGADLYGADLYGADLRGANLRGANLRGANLRGADLYEADLYEADLRCFGDMNYIRTMQFDKWAIGYTSDTLQIGCQRHPISKWRKWNTPAGKKWIAQMDPNACDWAERNMNLVLTIIDANPAEKHVGHIEEGEG